MNPRPRIPAAISVLLLIGVGLALWFGFHRKSTDSPHPAKAEVSKSNPAAKYPASDLLPGTNTTIEDGRPEVQALYRFANAVKIYNFNTQIIVYKTNQTLREMEVATPSHSAEIVRGFPMHLSSHYDGSDTRANPDAVKTWYECTGTWNEKGAVEETLATLERLGKSDVAQCLSNGPHEYLAETIRVLTPDGKDVEVAPFPKVGFKNSNIVLEVEYRMGSNGPAGLTKWFYLGP